MPDSRRGVKPRITRGGLALALSVASCLLTTAPGWMRASDLLAQDRPATEPAPAQYETERVSLVLPKGDALAGRQAFLDLRCTACHQVVGETTFPQPVAGTQGPDLDQTLGSRPVSELAAAIVVPSHSVSVRISDAVKERLRTTLLSPMGDFSGAMTVRQLTDLLAYLGSL